MSEWRNIWGHGLPNEGRSPESGHRMAAEGMPFPWRWDGGTISMVLDVIWGMSANEDILDHCCYAWNQLTQQPWMIMSIGLRDWAYA